MAVNCVASRAHPRVLREVADFGRSKELNAGHSFFLGVEHAHASLKADTCCLEVRRAFHLQIARCLRVPAPTDGSGWCIHRGLRLVRRVRGMRSYLSVQKNSVEGVRWMGFVPISLHAVVGEGYVSRV